MIVLLSYQKETITYDIYYRLKCIVLLYLLPLHTKPLSDDIVLKFYKRFNNTLFILIFFSIIP